MSSTWTDLDRTRVPDPRRHSCSGWRQRGTFLSWVECLLPRFPRDSFVVCYVILANEDAHFRVPGKAGPQPPIQLCQKYQRFQRVEPIISSVPQIATPWQDARISQDDDRCMAIC